jgi:hypothetical protein
MYSAGFPEAHFTHVFVDEAGHAMEPEALISLAGYFYIFSFALLVSKIADNQQFMSLVENCVRVEVAGGPIKEENGRALEGGLNFH